METNTKSHFPEPEVSLCGGVRFFILPFCSSYASIFRFLIINGACEQSRHAGSHPVVPSQPSDLLHFLRTSHTFIYVFCCFHNMCLCVDLSRQNLSRTQNCVIVDNKQTKHTYEQLTTPNGAFYF